MEGVAHREAEREELHKEMANLEMRLFQRKQTIKEVEQQQRHAAEAARSEAQELDIKRRNLLQQIEDVRDSFGFCFLCVRQWFWTRPMIASCHLNAAQFSTSSAT